MIVVLELQDQPSNIKKVTIRHDVVIGRGGDSNLRLSAPQVSRRHCFLRVGRTEVTISDLDSCNGTYLNGKRIVSGKRHPVSNGMILAVGPVKFIARVSQDVSSSKPLEVQLQEGRKAKAAKPGSLADEMAEADISSLKLSIEHAGPAAAEDEPTADYVSGETFDARYVQEADVARPPLEFTGVEPETAAGVPEAIEVAEVVSVAGDDDIEFVDEIIEVDEEPGEEVIEVAELIEGGEPLEFAEVLEVVDDDDEVLAIDESDIIDEPSSESIAGSEASDLRDFLGGTD